jgi:subtilisin family serine protease
MPEDAPEAPYVVVRIPDQQQVEVVSERILARLAGEDGSCLEPLGDGHYLVAGTAASLLVASDGELEALQWLRSLDGVALAEIWTTSRVEEALAARTPEPREAAIAGAPPDQWYLDEVGARPAWERFEGGLAGFAWRDLRIGHIDTGYREHPVFGFGEGGYPPSIRPELGRNFLERTRPPLDPCPESGQPGHGTRTGSVIAGHLGNHFHGVAPRATIVPFRVTTSVVFGRLFNPAKVGPAITAAVDPSADCRVISISLGSIVQRRALRDPVRAAYAAGVIVVAAAGNFIDEVVYPARYAQTIAVAGSTRRRRPWAKSAFGPFVDVAAPADEIARARTCGEGDGVSGSKGDGTSYATAMVAGAAALWLTFHRDRLGPYAGWRTVEAFRHCLKRSARRPDNWEPRLWGAGILDVDALLGTELPHPDRLRAVGS